MSSYSDAKISFYREGKVSLRLPARAALKKFIESIFKQERKQIVSLTYVFCNDRFLLKLNQEYLDHNEYTDIITFDLSGSDGIQGEVYISLDRVRENARLHHTSLKSELHRVIFHGALHLCGYTDKNKKAQSQMRSKEDAYLQKYFRST